MIAALIAAVGFYTAMFIIWSIPGMITLMAATFVDWHNGRDVTFKEILLGLLGGAALGWIVTIFGIGYLFQAIALLFGITIQPFNFTIKGRKRK